MNDREKNIGEGRKEKATFSIKGVQKDFFGEENVVELITEGDVTFLGDHVLLQYDESELSGMAGNSTSIELRENSVSMVRSGDANVTMHFEKGKRSFSHYNTPFGAISMSVYGNSVYHKMDAKGGQVQLDYILDMDGGQSFEYMFSMDIKVK